MNKDNVRATQGVACFLSNCRIPVLHSSEEFEKEGAGSISGDDTLGFFPWTSFPDPLYCHSLINQESGGLKRLQYSNLSDVTQHLCRLLQDFLYAFQSVDLSKELFVSPGVKHCGLDFVRVMDQSVYGRVHVHWPTDDINVIGQPAEFSYEPTIVTNWNTWYFVVPSAYREAVLADTEESFVKACDAIFAKPENINEDCWVSNPVTRLDDHLGRSIATFLYKMNALSKRSISDFNKFEHCVLTKCGLPPVEFCEPLQSSVRAFPATNSFLGSSKQVCCSTSQPVCQAWRSTFCRLKDGKPFRYKYVKSVEDSLNDVFGFLNDLLKVDAGGLRLRHILDIYRIRPEQGFYISCVDTDEIVGYVHVLPPWSPICLPSTPCELPTVVTNWKTWVFVAPAVYREFMEAATIPDMHYYMHDKPEDLSFHKKESLWVSPPLAFDDLNLGATLAVFLFKLFMGGPAVARLYNINGGRSPEPIVRPCSSFVVVEDEQDGYEESKC